MRFALSKPILRVQPDVVEAGSGLRVFIKPELLDAW
jgi:hypothetical protein